MSAAGGLVKFLLDTETLARLFPALCRVEGDLPAPAAERRRHRRVEQVPGAGAVAERDRDAPGQAGLYGATVERQRRPASHHHIAEDLRSVGPGAAGVRRIPPEEGELRRSDTRLR